MGTSAAFIAVCVTALVDGGPGLLATLVAVSALFQFRAVQGAVTADGVGNLLSGLAATVPNTTYSSSVSITAITGVAARTVGVYIGIAFIVLAFLPKFMALILAIPGPVVGAYTIVLMATLFVLGMRVVSADHQG